MPLSRQLLIIFLLIFSLVFAGTFAISINNTRNYLLQRMESHAQDTATMLGLTLTTQMNDKPAIDSLVDAVFDRGYYQEIVIETMQGERLIERVNPLKIAGVPNWFVKLIPLTTPRRDALIMSGWTQNGRVLITSHPGYAYLELWRNAAQTLIWFSICSLLALALGVFLLRALLRPLKAVENQAEAICNRRYPILDKLPLTRELRQVVSAMNKVSRKVEQMFKEQTDLTEKLRAQVYQDPLTGLGNRRYFDTQLANLIQSPEEFSNGALLLLQLQDLNTINQVQGYPAGDQLLCQAAKTLKTNCSKSGEFIVARIAGADFAIVAPDFTGSEADALAQSVLRDLTDCWPDDKPRSARRVHIGIAMQRPRQPAAELVATADMALRKSQSLGPSGVQRFSEDTVANLRIFGADEWRQKLQEKIGSGEIILHQQPIVEAQSGDPWHQEILARIPEGSDLVTAGVFIPMAARAGLSAEVDKLVIDSVLKRIFETSGNTRFAVNLAHASIQDEGFQSWLENRLRQASEYADQLIFETSEYFVLQNLDPWLQLIESLNPLGCQFGLDHFGRGLAAFAYLRKLNLEYLKIDGAFIRQIDQNPDNQFFIQALIKTAHELDIKVIAEAVESKAEKETMIELHVDGLQGYYIGKPIQ